MVIDSIIALLWFNCISLTHMDSSLPPPTLRNPMCRSKALENVEIKSSLFHRTDGPPDPKICCSYIPSRIKISIVAAYLMRAEKRDHDRWKDEGIHVVDSSAIFPGYSALAASAI